MLYISDTIIFPNAVQLLILTVMFVIIILWDKLVKQDHWSLRIILRFIQFICICQALVSFYISMPYFADSWEDGSILLTIGVAHEADTTE